MFCPASLNKSPGGASTSDTGEFEMPSLWLKREGKIDHDFKVRHRIVQHRKPERD